MQFGSGKPLKSDIKKNLPKYRRYLGSNQKYFRSNQRESMSHRLEKPFSNLVRYVAAYLVFRMTLVIFINGNKLILVLLVKEN